MKWKTHGHSIYIWEYIKSKHTTAADKDAYLSVLSNIIVNIQRAGNKYINVSMRNSTFTLYTLYRSNLISFNFFFSFFWPFSFDTFFEIIFSCFFFCKCYMYEYVAFCIALIEGSNSHWLSWRNRSIRVSVIVASNRENTRKNCTIQ